MKRLVIVAAAVLFSVPLFSQGTDSIEFIQSLSAKDTATVQDAVLLFSLQGGGPVKNFAAAKDFLIEKGILKESEYDPAAPLRRGLLAGMTARMLSLRGSLLFIITGADRYACTACLADGIMKGQVSEFDRISGSEFVEILGAISSRGAGNE